MMPVDVEVERLLTPVDSELTPVDRLLTPVDSTSGEFVGKQAGPARIQARTGDLRTNPISVTVFTPPAP